MRLFALFGRTTLMVLMTPFGVTLLAVTFLLTTPLLFAQISLGVDEGPADWVADTGTQGFRRVMTPWEARRA